MAKFARTYLDCLENCQSSQHGSEIISAITQRGISDQQLATYILNLCAGLKQQSNDEGCTALHMAASCGRVELCRWLLKALQVDINKGDLESGFTALHRSIFYGQIHAAVELIRLGANVSITDKDALIPFDHALLDQNEINRLPSDISVWGNNNNYILGMGSETSRSNPIVHEFFRKQKIVIKKICMDKFHSIFLSTEGKVWAAGHGLGGRLGLISEQTALEPQQIKTQPAEVFKSISIGRDHSVMLAESGAVYTCGLNTYHQLGLIPPPPKLVAPRRINLSKNYTILGVAAARFHSIFWNKTLIFSCGLHAGQLGHEFSDRLTIDDPALVKSIPIKSGCEISHVATSTGAIVIVTKGEVYSLCNYKTNKISSRLNEIVGNVQKVSIIGGHLDPNRAQLKIKTDQSNQELKIAILGENSVFVWTETRPNFARCQYSIKASVRIIDIHFSLSNLMLVSHFGVVFFAAIKFNRKAKKTPEKKKLQCSRLHPNVKLDGTIFLNLIRIPSLYRAMSITSDPEGENFAVIQRSPKSVAKVINLAVPALESELPDLMSDFLTETCEADSVHDVIFEVAQQRFPAHRVIVARGSKEIYNLIKALPSNENIISLPDIDPLCFGQILEYIYSGSCSLLLPGKCPERFANEMKSGERFNPICLLEETARKLQMSDLVQKLKYYKFSNGLIIKKPGDKVKKRTGYCVDAASFRLMLKGGANAFEKCIQAGDIDEMDSQKFENDQWKSATEIYLSPHFTAIKYVMTNPRNTNDFGRELFFVTKTDSKGQFTRHNSPEFYDLIIETSDKQSVKAHKCILLSRVEYFRCMLSGSWREMTAVNSIRLPFPKALVEGLLDFIYSERVFKSLADSDAADFYKCLLMIANFMLLPGLKRICEQSLCNILTLKNVVPLLQMSALHSASQLKQFCFTFICQNAAELLDLRYLDVLNFDMLEELTCVYKENNHHLCWRHISSFCSVRHPQEIVEFNKQCPPLPWNVIEDNDEVPDTISSPKSSENKISSRKKLFPRIRKTSNSESSKVRRSQNRSDSCSSTSADMEVLSNLMKTINLEDSPTEPYLWDRTDNENSGDWIKIEKVQSRLKLNALVKNDPSLLDLKNSEMTELVPRSEPINIPITNKESCDTPPTPMLQDTQAFPSLGSSPFSSNQSSSKTYQPIRSSDWKKGKHKKTVFATRGIIIIEEKEKKPDVIAESLPITVESPKSPWGCVRSRTDASLEIVMKQERQHSSPSAKEAEMSFSAIIAEEQQKRDNFEKMKSKPLSMIQMEDQAIEALLVFYNARNCFDERITVRRVLETNIAAPTWITKR